MKIVKIEKVRFYDDRFRCNFPLIDRNLALFDIVTDLTKQEGFVRTNTFGYGYKNLDLKTPTGEEEDKPYFQIIFEVYSTRDFYPKDPYWAGNRRDSRSKILYGLICNEEAAKLHCENLAEEERGKKIKEFLEREKRNKELPDKYREMYGMLEIKIL